jgi:hypothetical protein
MKIRNTRIVGSVVIPGHGLLCPGETSCDVPLELALRLVEEGLELDSAPSEPPAEHAAPDSVPVKPATRRRAPRARKGR